MRPAAWSRLVPFSCMEKFQSAAFDQTPTEKTKIVRKRWHMLAQVLTGESCAEVVDSSVSVRRFQSFGLLSTAPAEPDHCDQGEGDGQWYTYTCQDFPGFSMNIRHLSGSVSARRLNGFNNTGNVCVWPSEEVMTYYCLQHVLDFRNQKVCELGGGMTCLAGVALGVCSEASLVELTDGNTVSVENLKSIIERNIFGGTSVSARHRRWGKDESAELDVQSLFDWVLCADCLFFDDCREDLVHLIFELLKPGGQALVFAPSRNNTFHKFMDLAKKSFQVLAEKEYDTRIWSIHQKMLQESPGVYDASLHYPLLLKLTKPLRDGTPESR